MPLNDQPKYRKFSKRRASLFRVDQLWAAHDHLLLVTSVYAFERYRRFYFHDLEALVIRPTKVRRAWVIASALLLALFGGLVGLFWLLEKQGKLSADSSAGFAIVCGLFAGLFLFLLLAQLALGPTCVVNLQLRTGLEKLAMFHRLRPALKLRKQLLQAIAESAAVAQVSP